jgi:oxygen-dependent protoporphyrinogen oxidase
MNKTHRIVVIGAGITGLSAAYRLTGLGAERGLPLDVTVLEGRERPGGVISTRHSGGFLAEEGPDSFLKSKPEALSLSIRAGLGPDIIGISGESGRVFIIRNGAMIPLPDGIFPAPTSMAALFNSQLLSMRGKLRMTLEPFLPRGDSRGDESAASFIRRRFGREAYERIAEPLLTGIYAGDPETLSVRAALPALVKMEEEYGSVARGMRRNGAARGGSKNGGGGGGRFATFGRGMGTLISTLASGLPGNSLRLKSRVKRIETAGRGFRIHLNGGNPLECDAVIAALPAPQASLITGGIELELSESLSRIKYVSTAVINLGYRRSDVTHTLTGSGFVVPSSERLPVLACTFSSVKFAGRSPDDAVLLRVISGGAQNPDICSEDDGQLIKLAHGALSPILGIKSEPVYSLVSRNPESMPHYAVGHGALVARIMETASAYPGLRLAGNAYGGVGVPDCVRSGEEAAEDIFSYIARRGTRDEGNKSRRRA